MGESFIVVNLLKEGNQIDTPTSSQGEKLRLKLFAGPSNGEVLY